MSEEWFVAHRMRLLSKHCDYVKSMRKSFTTSAPRHMHCSARMSQWTSRCFHTFFFFEWHSFFRLNLSSSTIDILQHLHIRAPTSSLEVHHSKCVWFSTSLPFHKWQRADCIQVKTKRRPSHVWNIQHRTALVTYHKIDTAMSSSDTITAESV